MDVTVRRIDAADTHDLRRRVLRAGVPDPRVDLAMDHDPGALHFGAFAGERLAAVVTFYDPAITGDRDGRGWQFRFMAVEPEMQGHGIGRRLLDGALADLAGRGVTRVWANARDSALGFYTRLGFTPVGESFVHSESGLAHTVVVRDVPRP